MALLRSVGIPADTARTFPADEAITSDAPSDRAIDARNDVWQALDELTAWNVECGDTVDRSRENLWRGWALTHKLQRALCALDNAQWGAK